MGRPSFPFYPNDWLNDLALRGCSPATRGIWVDLLCIMHEGTPYGHLADATGALSSKFIASRCGVTVKGLASILQELEVHEVFSRTDEGTIFSRRMVRDEYNRLVRGQGGSQSQKSPFVPRPKRIPSGIEKGILPSDQEGILTRGKAVPSFGPVNGEGYSCISVLEVQEVKNGKAFDPLPGWVQFKRLYPPHRVNPYMDCQLWISIVESAEIESEILAKLPGFKVSEQWQKDGGKFVPKASKFLGERQFEMEPGPLPHTPERKLSVTEQAEANWMRDHPGETI